MATWNSFFHYTISFLLIHIDYKHYSMTTYRPQDIIILGNNSMKTNLMSWSNLLAILFTFKLIRRASTCMVEIFLSV